MGLSFHRHRQLSCFVALVNLASPSPSSQSCRSQLVCVCFFFLLLFHSRCSCVVVCTSHWGISDSISISDCGVTMDGADVEVTRMPPMSAALLPATTTAAGELWNHPDRRTQTCTALKTCLTAYAEGVNSVTKPGCCSPCCNFGAVHTSQHCPNDGYIRPKFAHSMVMLAG